MLIRWLQNVPYNNLRPCMAWDSETRGRPVGPPACRVPLRFSFYEAVQWDACRQPRPEFPRARRRRRWDEVGPPGGSRPHPADRRAAARLALTADELCEVQRSGSRPISRVLSWTTIHLGLASPRASSDLPGNSCGPQVRARKPACFPIWSCSRWGLPCRRMLPPTRCALTAPFHPCRHCIAAALGRSALCCTFRGLAPPRRYLAPCPVEPGLSSAK